MKIKTICMYSILCIFLFVLLAVPVTLLGADASAGKKAADAAVKRVKEYRIGSGDVLDIFTWKEPDFSREELYVRIDGKITFPLLGDVRAAGLTPQQLKANIEIKLTTYIEAPVVTVTVRVPGSQKFYVVGEVVRPGEYNLVKNLSVIQAFALAGGFTEWASKDEILLFRKENGKETVFRVDYKLILKGENFKSNISLKADDTIIVP